MTTTETTTPEVITKPLSGVLFMKDAVTLAPREDGSERVMGVLQVATPNGVVRVTDFTKQHENLVEDQPIKLVYEETHQVRDERKVTFRNLVSAIQA